MNRRQVIEMIINEEGFSPQGLTADALSAYLPAGRLNGVLCLDTVDSTNKRLREMACENAPAGQVVLANGQTQGRGRLGRSFLSPEGKGIYLSYLFDLAHQQGDVASITAWVAVSVCNAIENVCGVRPGIKWVNDLLLNQKKICGILTEALAEGGCVRQAVIGIGVNVNESEEDFPQELRPIASSLGLWAGCPFCRAQLAAEIIRELDAMAAAWPGEKQRYLTAYRSGCVTVGKAIRVISSQGERPGVATAVQDDFSLAVNYDDGSSASLSSGEVSVRW